MNRADWRAEYPFASHWLALDPATTDGSTSPAAPIRVHYIDEGVRGPASNAGTILAVHGNPTWSFYYRHLVTAMRATHRVVAIDHIGMGQSDKPQQYDYSLTQHRNNLIALIDHLNLTNITLVAHDWGGAIGLAALLERRDRFSRIILLNTAAFPPPYVPWRIAICRWPLIGPFLVRGLNGFARAALVMTTHRQRLDPIAGAGMIAPYDSWDHRVAIWKFVRDIPRHRSDPTWQLLDHIHTSLPSLAPMPVHLIWGMRDWCFRPECLTRLQQAWPHASTTAIEDAGHYVIEDARDEVIEAIQAACHVAQGLR
jgi:cis-3-alkyl-4-acyloxetan-2-one decarboxylase